MTLLLAVYIGFYWGIPQPGECIEDGSPDNIVRVESHLGPSPSRPGVEYVVASIWIGGPGRRGFWVTPPAPILMSKYGGWRHVICPVEEVK